MTLNSTPFPLKIATGTAFCNRENERSLLTKYIKSGHHVWLQAHRRHGKSSLIMQVEADHEGANERIVSERADMAFSTSKSDILRLLCNSAALLISKIIKSARRLDEDSLLIHLLKEFKAKWKQSSPDISLERGMPTIQPSDPPSLEKLKRILQYIDEVAGQHNIRAVFIIDEFQQIGKAHKKDKDFAIEGIIRHCLEQSQYTTFIFCGSENTLMAQAMEDKNRPLHKHTFKISLNRISGKEYHSHINGIHQQKWGMPITQSVFDDIMALSQRHPYYVNKICALLWLNDCPTQDHVMEAWYQIMDEESFEHKKTALQLSTNERILVKALSQNPTKQPTGAEFSKSLEMPHGSILRTMTQLIEKDIVYLNDGTYFVINPVFAYLISS